MRGCADAAWSACEGTRCQSKGCPTVPCMLPGCVRWLYVVTALTDVQNTLQVRAEDEEVFEMNPIEYIRRDRWARHAVAGAAPCLSPMMGSAREDAACSVP